MAAQRDADGLPVKLSAPPPQPEGALEKRAKQQAAERVALLKTEEERLKTQLEFGRARYAAAVAAGVNEMLASKAHFRHEQRSQEVAALLRQHGADGRSYYKDPVAASLPPSPLWNVQPYLRAAADRERRIRGGDVELWVPNEYSSYCVTAPVGKRADQCDPLGTFLFGLFTPSGPCPVRDRVGNINDGGKWTCAPELVRSAERCIIYSFGVADDTSFEAAMIRGSRNCMVHAFDIAFDVLALAREDADIAPRINYKAVGLAPDAYVHGATTFLPLEQIMGELGHNYVDILKLDIEGAELNVGIQAFYAWAQAGRAPVGQLLVELHMADQPPWKLVTFFRAAEAAGFVPFHSELNPVPCVQLSNLPRRPDFHEFSFVHVGNMRSRYNWSLA